MAALLHSAVVQAQHERLSEEGRACHQYSVRSEPGTSKRRALRRLAAETHRNMQRLTVTVAEDLGRFVMDTDATRMPAKARERAAMLIASTLASAAAGAAIQSAAVIRGLTRDRGGVPEASLWFDAGPRLPAAEAARANAMMSDAAASDDSDLRNVTHPGTQAVAASLALAE